MTASTTAPEPPLMLEHRLAVPAHVYSRPFGEQVVLLDFGQGDYYGLDEVGAVLWSTAEQGGCVGDAVTRVIAEFDGALHEEVTKDLLALATDLIQHGLLERP